MIIVEKMNIPFSPPDISELEIQYVCDALRSGWITTGPKVKELEKKIASYFDVNKTVCLNSQTACAEMSLRLLGIGEGDEVIVPSYTYTATASVVAHVGAKIVMIDTQADCLEMDYDAVEKAVNEKTKAIIAVDIAGIPCDYDRLFEIAKSKKGLFNPKTELQKAIGRIAVLADTAHSFGAERNGKKAGSIADFSSTSFHAVKNLTTAEGGALSWRSIEGVSDDDIYRQLQLFSLHGQSKDALAKTQIGAWEYDIIAPYFKCNMTDIQAAMGLAQFERYPDLLKRRREIIEKYDSVLKPLGVKTLNHYGDNHSSSGHLYITNIPGITALERNEIIIKMAEAGIVCNVHYKPLPMHTAYKNLGFDISDFPNAYAHFSTCVTLPLHTKLTDDEIEYILDNYTRILGDYIK